MHQDPDGRPKKWWMDNIKEDMKMPWINPNGDGYADKQILP